MGLVSLIFAVSDYPPVDPYIGIGLLLARALAPNGAHKVYIIGRRKAVLEEAAGSVTTNNMIPLVGDVTSKEALSSIVATITSEVGYISTWIVYPSIAHSQRAKLS